MQTQLMPSLAETPEGQRAEEILRKCVHCGFCTATCPTYQLLGEESDSPRGRIYLIKQMLEGKAATRTTQQHLDRCLTCLSCETTCPSGVKYGQLVEIGKQHAEREIQRPVTERAARWTLRQILPYRRRFGSLMQLGQWVRPAMPKALKQMVPPAVKIPKHSWQSHSRFVILPLGCAQPSMAPNTDYATRKVLDHLQIRCEVPDSGCCGAVDMHLQAADTALQRMRQNIDQWWPLIERGAEAIISNASGCGAFIKHYGDHLRNDPTYAKKAAKVAELCVDISEFLSAQDVSQLPKPDTTQRIAFHPPCTLQHGQKLPNVTERLLSNAGFTLVPFADKHLCCGSAGTYSLLQPTLSHQLRERKLNAIEKNQPDLIATANIGCQHHLQEKAGVPVVHWIELMANALPVRD